MRTTRTDFPLLASQQSASCRVTRLLKIGLAGAPLNGFRVRTYPLLMAPSGVGKTEIVKWACEELGMALCHLSVMSWVIYAAKKPGTIECLSGWIEGLKRPGLIFLDELDKLRSETMSTSAWHADAMTEILALLDNDTRLASMGMKPAIVARLGKDVFFAGAGAWQVLFRQGERQALGFGKRNVSEKSESLPTAALRDSVYGGVPEEILNRFAVPIAISPLTKLDYAQALTHVHEKLGEPMPTREKLDELSELAVREGIGFRWVERYLTELAIQRMERQEQDDLIFDNHPEPKNGHTLEPKPTTLSDCHSEKEFSQYIADLQAKARNEEEAESTEDIEEAPPKPRWKAKQTPVVSGSKPARGEKNAAKLWEIIRTLAANIRNSACNRMMDLPDTEAVKRLSDISAAAQSIQDQTEDPSLELANTAQILDAFFVCNSDCARMQHYWRELSNRFPDVAAQGYLGLWIQTLQRFLNEAEEEYRR
ncbi:MAG: hypothetical protein B9S32_03755 [Verrucomicrobia bacterium Tous-C9LFEB]|nr:MAG: hypothetical protein B9S32_03755 [Verrucomicrobia bacterium Tous-C9LFEB]